ncbi:NB-ARC domain-containing protein [Lentzea sp. NPDC102401]|uniref:NB-ARC domain-containing protein n=1 Tax=Lentzea sp. NPDC102401 TaxID=3364128 RepID=UPI0037FD0206
MSEGRVARLLPPDTVGFHDRTPQLLDLRRLVIDAGGPVRCLITGLAGIGKTWFAIRTAHDLSSRFQGAQLYYDLRGSTGHPADPSDVLRHFLTQLGLGHSEIPAHEEERATVFRSLTANTHVLVMLDDADSVTQVRKLLPSSPHSLVLVTSRNRLANLRTRHGFHQVDLGALDTGDARHLLTRFLDLTGSEAEERAIAQLLDLCAGVPLSLSVAAARLDGRGTLIDVVVEQILAGRSLDLLVDDDDLAVEAIFDMSYARLSPDAAVAYRSLTLHPGPDFGLPAAAALLDATQGKALQLIDELVEATLLEARGGGRFGFHEVVREHAHRLALDEDSPEIRRAIRLRSAMWYLRHQIALCKAIAPRWTVSALFDEIEKASPDEASVELEREYSNVMRAFAVLDELCADELLPAFCEAVQSWQYNTRRSDDVMAVASAALAAAQRLGDQRAEMRVRNLLGTGYELAGAFEKALEQFETSLDLARRLGHVLGEQSALEWIGLVYGGQGVLAQAIPHLRQSAEVAEHIADPVQRERALTLHKMHVERLLNRASGTSIADLAGLSGYFRDNGEHVNEARILTRIATAHRAQGQAGPAVLAWKQAAAAFARGGAVALQAEALRQLADVEDELGEHDSAAAHRADADRLTRP